MNEFEGRRFANKFLKIKNSLRNAEESDRERRIQSKISYFANDFKNEMFQYSVP